MGSSTVKLPDGYEPFYPTQSTEERPVEDNQYQASKQRLPEGYEPFDPTQSSENMQTESEKVSEDPSMWERVRAGAHELMMSMIPAMKPLEDRLKESRKIQKVESGLSRYTGKPESAFYEPPAKSDDEIRADAIRAKLQNVETLYGDLVDMGRGAFGNEEAAVRWKQKYDAMNAEIVDLLNQAGIEARMTEKGVLFKGKDGTIHSLEDVSSIAEDIKASTGEIAGGIGGAYAGARTGATIAPGATKPIGALLGGMIGAYLGSGSGKAIDVLRNAAEIGKDVSATDVILSSLDAGAASAVTDAALTSGGKIAAKGLKKIADPVMDIVRADGRQGTKQVLEEAGHTLKGAGQIADEMNKFSSPEGSAGRAEAIQDAGLAAAMTDKSLFPDLEGAIKLSPKGAVNISKSVEGRAEKLREDLMKNSLRPAELQKKIKAYEEEVSDFFGGVQDRWKQAFDGYRFAIDDLPIPDAREIFPKLKNVENPKIEDVLEALKEDIQRQDVVEQLSALQKRIAGEHDIEDLLDLRKELGRISRLPSVKAYKGQKALQAYIDAVDSQIDALPERAGYPKEIGDELRSLFKRSNQEYTAMKRMQDGIAYKRIMRPGSGEDDVNNVLVKLSESINDELEDLFSKLPKDDGTRAKAEVSLLSSRLDKAIKEVGNSNRKAVDFGKLKESLDAINEDLLKTNEARSTLEALRNMSDLFLNDLEIQKLAGNVREKVSNNIATTLFGKIRMYLSSQTFKTLQSKMPGRKGAHLAYQANVAKALERARTPEDLAIEIQSAAKNTGDKKLAAIDKMLTQYNKRMEDARDAVSRMTKEEFLQKADDLGFNEAEKMRLMKYVKKEAIAPQPAKQAKQTVTKEEIEALRTNPPTAEEARVMERLGPKDKYGTFAQDIRYIKEGRASDAQLAKYIEAKRSVDPVRFEEELAKERMPKTIEEVTAKHPGVDAELFLKERLEADLRKDPYGFSVNKDTAKRIMEGKATSEELQKLADDLAHIEADPQWVDHYGLGKVYGDTYIAPDGETVDLNTVFSNPGVRMGAGFAGGTANVFENADQNDDGVITLDETASAFAKGFLAGSIAPDVIKAIGKTNPKLYEKVTERLLDETANGMKVASNIINKEKKNILKVAMGDKTSTVIRKYDGNVIDEIIKITKGHHSNATGRGKGASHVAVRHMKNGTTGTVTLKELMEIGKVVNNAKPILKDGKRVYQWYDKENGVRYRVITHENENDEIIITFYSNRKKDTTGLGHDAQDYDFATSGDKTIITFKPKTSFKEWIKKVDADQSK